MAQKVHQTLARFPLWAKDWFGQSREDACQPSDKLKHASIVIFLALFALTFAVFFNSVSGEFLRWDDDLNITHNPHLHGLNAENLGWMFTDTQYVRRYIPLTWLAWGLDYQLFGLTAYSCHFGNILFHSLNAALSFLLIRKLLRLALRADGNAGLERAILIGSALGSLLWAVHPLRVETVAWASGRIYSQALMFALLSLLSYLGFVGSEPGTTRRVWLYWASVGSLALSLLTYPLLLSFAGVLMILDFYPLRRFAPGGLWNAAGRRIWLEKIPFIAVIAGVLAVTLLARAQAAGVWRAPTTLETFGPLSRMMQAFYIWAYYVWKPFVPTDLSPVYTTLIHFRPGDTPFVVSLLLVVLFTSVLLWKRRRWPAALALWLGHLFLLVPVLGLTEHPHYSSDRYCYVASIACFIAVAAGVALAVRQSKWRVPACALSAGVAVVFAMMSLRQIPVWRSTDTLFQHMISTISERPLRVPVQRRWGMLLAGQGRLDEAAEQFSAALEIEPGLPDLHKKLGDVLEAQQKHPEALRHYREAARLDPAFVEARQKVEQLSSLAGQLPSQE